MQAMTDVQTMSADDARRLLVERAYRTHVDDVYRVAYAILHEPESAADATQETFARAYERWERYDPARPLRPWLHAIVARIAIDLVRRRRIRERTIPFLRPRIGAASDERTHVSAAPDAEVARRETVDAGLAVLRPTARAAIVLRHYYGYDYAEIAGLLGTSAGNVGSILSRAHAELRRRLDAG